MTRALIAAVLLAGACGRPSSQEAPVAQKTGAPVWSAYRDGREVLRFKEGAGPVTGTALPPPGTPPARSAFVTATALDAASEDALRGALEASRSFADFTANLKKAGFEVRPSSSPL